jgi:hypothetical protein
MSVADDGAIAADTVVPVPPHQDEPPLEPNEPGMEFVTRRRRRPSIGPLIVKHFADGKWRPEATLVAKVCPEDPDHVRSTLGRMSYHTGYHGVRAEQKRVGLEIQWRVIKLDKTISVIVLVEKLSPIVAALKEEGKRSVVTMSPTKVALLAGRLGKLLHEWSE